MVASMGYRASVQHMFLGNHPACKPCPHQDVQVLKFVRIQPRPSPVQLKEVHLQFDHLSWQEKSFQFFTVLHAHGKIRTSCPGAGWQRRRLLQEATESLANMWPPNLFFDKTLYYLFVFDCFSGKNHTIAWSTHLLGVAAQNLPKPYQITNPFLVLLFG